MGLLERVVTGFGESEGHLAGPKGVLGLGRLSGEAWTKLSIFFLIFFYIFVYFSIFLFIFLHMA